MKGWGEKFTFGEIKNFVGEEVKKFNETIIKYDTVLINLSQNIKKKDN